MAFTPLLSAPRCCNAGSDTRANPDRPNDDNFPTKTLKSAGALMARAAIPGSGANYLTVSAGLGATLGTAAVRAQTFPERPIKIIMPFAAGNTLDVSLRQVSEIFLRSTGQPIIIENKPGGSGLIAAQACAQAAPDGYTLLLGNTSMLTINPHTFSKLPYDPVKSFRPVTNFLGATMVFAAHAAVPANNLKEWIAYAKANPAKTNFASFTAGNSSHFAGVLLNKHAGIDMVHVPHNGTPPAVQNLLGAQVQTAFLPLMAVKPHVESGKIKVFAVTSSKRSALIAWHTDLYRGRFSGSRDLHLVKHHGAGRHTRCGDQQTQYRIDARLALGRNCRKMARDGLRATAQQSRGSSAIYADRFQALGGGGQDLRIQGRRLSRVLQRHGAKQSACQPSQIQADESPTFALQNPPAGVCRADVSDLRT